MSAIISAIVASARPGVLAVTGGGSLAISDVLSQPGASDVILEALVPYSAPALTDLLQATPEQFCSARTARAMAMTCFWRALHWSASQLDEQQRDAQAQLVWGAACTASLVTQRPKRGDHRLHVAVQTADFTLTLSATLTKGLRTRVQEERLAADGLLYAIAQGCGLDGYELPPLQQNERWDVVHTVARDDWRDIMLGRVDAVYIGQEADAENGAGDEVEGDQRECGEENGDEGHQPVPTSGVLFPGAFNPIHEGHRAMAELAQQRLGRSVEFEISIENVDKPLMDYTELAQRLDGFRPSDAIWLTRAPTFVEKARLFPGTTFIVGMDTLVRIGAPHYYGDDPQRRNAALDELDRLGCRFLVFARTLAGDVPTLAELDLPAKLRQMTEEVPESSFRRDISSTELRAQMRGDS